MHWFELAQNPLAIKELFDDPPSLEKVRILEVALGQDGPSLDIRLNLNQYPKNPPERWRKQGFNTVQVTLNLFELEEFKMHGWSTNNILTITLEKQSNGKIFLLAQDSDTFLSVNCLCFRIAKFDAYCNEHII